MSGDWRRQARCAGMNTELFFAIHAGDLTPEARAICATCPVKAACRAEAHRLRDRHGFRGGESGKQRADQFGSPKKPDLTARIVRLSGRRWTNPAIANYLGVDVSVVWRVLKTDREQRESAA